MEKKQTAVDWLFLMINNRNDNQEMALKCLEKAKQMEKEQIIEVAMYHKDSCVQRACVESYISKHYGGQDEK